jgi:hypothetical protein
VEAETGGAFLAVIPAQAGIQSSPPPGFRVSRGAPGMTGCLEYLARVKRFVSEQERERRSNLCLSKSLW